MKRVLLGHVPVDSGRVLIADPCYACQVASGEDLGVVASTVYGDGTFPVYAESHEDDPGQVARLVIDLEPEGWDEAPDPVLAAAGIPEGGFLARDSHAASHEGR